ncbi:SDR family oxidoreductase [Thermosipho ferrireducens]|uniref:SDR family oxidoreductase n=1 Tax=Thermosipho ferrireducens TaxID=2571116 RepID=A0ABX7S873_9BACT|nr:SDR family oxidoreductase [Thermosipho ferrireducens]QTA38786.1 SDR family oxidoreductase [Thermosipho ferrireducens]
MLIEKLGLDRKTFTGKTAVVTGAGQGIGKELARALAWLGARVIIAEINEKTGVETEKQIRSEDGTVLFVRADVGDRKSIYNLKKIVAKKFGKVDILVNNAIIYRPGSILELPIETWDEVYRVNIRGAVMGIKAFLPDMLQQGHGVIVTVTSSEGMPYMASYFASKAALRSIGLSLAQELKNTGVYAFVFAPGMVDTPGGNAAFEALAPKYGMTYQEFVAMSPNPGFDGLMPPEACAAGLAYLIAYANEYHGQVVDPFQPLIRTGILKFSCSGKRSEIDSQELKLILELTTKVKKVLGDVERETNELDLFRRMWVNRAFQQRTGMSIKNWIENIAKLIEQLENLKKETGKVNEFLNTVSWLKPYLERLAEYFKKNKQDARGYFKDSGKLEYALKILNERQDIVQKLILELEKIS